MVQEVRRSVEWDFLAEGWSGFLLFFPHMWLVTLGNSEIWLPTFSQCFHRGFQLWGTSWSVLLMRNFVKTSPRGFGPVCLHDAVVIWGSVPTLEWMKELSWRVWKASSPPPIRNMLTAIDNIHTDQIQGQWLQVGGSCGRSRKTVKKLFPRWHAEQTASQSCKTGEFGILCCAEVYGSGQETASWMGRQVMLACLQGGVRVLQVRFSVFMIWHWRNIIELWS